MGEQHCAISSMEYKNERRKDVKFRAWILFMHSFVRYYVNIITINKLISFEYYQILLDDVVCISNAMSFYHKEN